MALSDEERRRRDRERKRRKRAAEAAPAGEPELPRIGLAAADTPRTQDASAEDAADEGADAFSNAAAAREFIAELQVPARARPLVPVLYRLAADLDGVFNTPQRASITAKYLEVMDRILDAAKPVEVDELDEMRRAYYLGEVPDGGIGDEEQEAG
ncbi:hypothetical protein H490_0103950 [Leucobacter sp. UCD-THU]|uniref:hypothetical protein n=1 Tax=Leucobacter sp. UCD-THU TaxID=1292023 RepID=UPI00036B5E3F|nr:hypothetical protein [Leucobacter sp. UCD-THU]EYT56035.1 hypothetical protein H490_0103950 [Leucobacter sp. UCD-THU]